MIQLFNFDLVAGRKFNVKMTGTNDADLYVRFDGEPNKTDYNCRPYINGSDETCTLVPPKSKQWYPQMSAPQSHLTLVLT